MSLILLGTSTYCCMYAFARLQQFASTPGFDLLSSLGTVPHLPLGQSHFNILTSVPPSAWLLRLCTSPASPGPTVTLRNEYQAYTVAVS